MSAHTKTLHIESEKLEKLVVIKTICPAYIAADIKRYISEMGLKCEIMLENKLDDTPIIARSAIFERTPGTILAGFRCRENITQAKLSELAGIPRRHISEMENGKRPIGKQNAKKLANVLKTDYYLFL